MVWKNELWTGALILVHLTSEKLCLLQNLCVWGRVGYGVGKIPKRVILPPGATPSDTFDWHHLGRVLLASSG